MVRLVYMLYNFLIMISANLRNKIGIIIPKIIGLLDNNNSGIRQACANAISKIAEHGKTGLLDYIIC